MIIIKEQLPWRLAKSHPKKEYYTLVSEFMLQQTQVKTVVPYFHNFIRKHKTLKAFTVLKVKF